MKKLMPRMANIIRKRRQTMITFVIPGREASRAFTTSLKPSFLLIILNGLNALRARSAFKLLNVPALAPPYKVITKSNIDATTTVKSSKFQAFLIYG